MPRLVAVLGGMSRQPGRGGGCRLRDRTLFFEIEMPCIIFISPIKQLFAAGPCVVLVFVHMLVSVFAYLLYVFV